MIKSMTYITAEGTKVSIKGGSRTSAINMLLIGCSQDERDRVPQILAEVNAKALKKGAVV